MDFLTNKINYNKPFKPKYKLFIKKKKFIKKPFMEKIKEAKAKRIKHQQAINMALRLERLKLSNEEIWKRVHSSYPDAILGASPKLLKRIDDRNKRLKWLRRRR